MEFWVLVIGGAILVGVVSYTWVSSRHAAQRRRSIDRGGNIDSREFIGQILKEETDKPKTGKSFKAKHASGGQEPVIGRAAQSSASPPSAPSGPRQASLIDNELETDSQDPGLKTRAEPAKSHQLAPDHKPELILVYVMARGDADFRCSAVDRILTRSDCVLDERGVFHFKDKEQRVRFSIVNALEPATFDHEKMNTSYTRGLAFFFETSGVGDKVRFESLMNNARQVSTELDGELLDEKREPFSSVREQRYRSDLAD